MSLRKRKVSKKVSDKILFRVYLVFAVIALFTVLIVWRMVKLQFVDASDWKEIAEKEQVRKDKSEARKGSILADDGTPLISTVQYYRVSIDPSLLDIEPESRKRDKDSLTALCDSLYKYFGNDEDFTSEYFFERITDAKKDKVLVNGKPEPRKHLYVLRQKVDFVQYRMLRSWPLFGRSKYAGGLTGEPAQNKRSFLMESFASYTLGRHDSTGAPIKGLEKWFEKDLQGRDGIMYARHYAGGAMVPEDHAENIPAVDGNDIVTTLNIDMQDIAEAALRSGLQQNRAKYGTAILMEVETGHIKAIANLSRENGYQQRLEAANEAGTVLPSSEIRYYEDNNYAISGRIEPGSTFKLAVLLALLEDRKIDPRDTIDTGLGSKQFYDRTMYDVKGYGKITAYEAFYKSSNVFFSSVLNEAYKDDPERFLSWLEKFRMDDAVATQIMGEPEPIITTPENRDLWNPTTLPWMSIGYNLKLTPLQILTFYNCVANNGDLLEPLLVSRVEDNGKIVREFEPNRRRKGLFQMQNVRFVKKCMEAVAEKGTARNIGGGEYRIAGKTGTAQKVKNGQYQKIYQASFCGYFPAENPKYSCYVLVDEPSAGAKYGGEVAGPIFRQIADGVIALDDELSKKLPGGTEAGAPPVTRKLYRKNAEQVYSQLGLEMEGEMTSSWTSVKAVNGKIEGSDLKIRKGVIPDLRGMSARDAVNALEFVGQKFKMNGHGKVERQSFPAGTAIRTEESIEIHLK